MSVSNLSTGMRPGVCLSSSRPTVPYEGQMIYETDTDMVAIWNGTAWRYIAATTPTNGTVLQVVTATYSTETDNSTTTYSNTGLSAIITPKSTSSKVLITVHHPICRKNETNSGNSMNMQIHRDIASAGFSSIVQIATQAGHTATALVNVFGISSSYFDSPATTSAITYKTMFANNVASSVVTVQRNAVPSTITLMEIAG
jgi:hypothetical protein